MSQSHVEEAPSVRMIVVCAACHRRLLWTYSGCVTCPAGHVGLFIPAAANLVRPMNTPFDGRRVDLFDGLRSDKIVDIEAGAENKGFWTFWVPSDAAGSRRSTR